MTPGRDQLHRLGRLQAPVRRSWLPLPRCHTFGAGQRQAALGRRRRCVLFQAKDIAHPVRAAGGDEGASNPSRRLFRFEAKQR